MGSVLLALFGHVDGRRGGHAVAACPATYIKGGAKPETQWRRALDQIEPVRTLAVWRGEKKLRLAASTAAQVAAQPAAASWAAANSSFIVVSGWGFSAPILLVSKIIHSSDDVAFSEINLVELWTENLCSNPAGDCWHAVGWTGIDKQC
jgi:hypothetical protein